MDLGSYGPQDPWWSYGAQDPWTSVLMDPRIHGPCEPQDPWTSGRVDPGIHGPGDSWTPGPMNLGTHGLQDSWTPGPVNPGTHGLRDLWIPGLVNPRTLGPKDSWTLGLVDTKPAALAHPGTRSSSTARRAMCVAAFWIVDDKLRLEQNRLYNNDNTLSITKAVTVYLNSTLSWATHLKGSQVRHRMCYRG